MKSVGCLFNFIGIIFSILSVVDFAGMFFDYDITGYPWTPIAFGVVANAFFSVGQSLDSSSE